MSKRRIPGVYALFLGAILAATGYGATFVLNRHYKAFGGTEIDTGIILFAAMAGTIISVPMVGWYAKRYGAARLSALGTFFLAIGFALIATTTAISAMGILGGVCIGAGWGGVLSCCSHELVPIGEQRRQSVLVYAFCGISDGRDRS